MHSDRLLIQARHLNFFTPEKALSFNDSDKYSPSVLTLFIFLLFSH